MASIFALKIVRRSGMTGYMKYSFPFTTFPTGFLTIYETCLASEDTCIHGPWERAVTC